MSRPLGEKERELLDAARAALAAHPEVIAAIRAYHEARDYGCIGANEGQWCCVDYLLGDVIPTQYE